MYLHTTHREQFKINLTYMPIKNPNLYLLWHTFHPQRSSQSVLILNNIHKIIIKLVFAHIKTLWIKLIQQYHPCHPLIHINSKSLPKDINRNTTTITWSYIKLKVYKTLFLPYSSTLLNSFWKTMTIICRYYQTQHLKKGL